MSATHRAMVPSQAAAKIRGTTLEATRLRVDIRGRTLIDALDARIEPGQLWCVLGRNGVGKTMLLHTLAGLHRPAGGGIALDGRPLAAWPVEALARVRGLLPQFVPTVIEMRVIDVVLMARHPHLGRWQWEGDDDRARGLDALAAVGLADHADRDAARLSGGERQRVAIAALLAQEVPLMMLDEPTAHLDLHHQVMVLRHLRALADDGRTVILSIHDLNLARRHATHAMLLRPDATVEAGPVASVMTEAALSAAFGHRLDAIALSDRTVFVAR